MSISLFEINLPILQTLASVAQAAELKNDLYPVLNYIYLSFDAEGGFRAYATDRQVAARTDSLQSMFYTSSLDEVLLHAADVITAAKTLVKGIRKAEQAQTHVMLERSRDFGDVLYARRSDGVSVTIRTERTQNYPAVPNLFPKFENIYPLTSALILEPKRFQKAVKALGNAEGIIIGATKPEGSNDHTAIIITSHTGIDVLMMPSRAPAYADNGFGDVYRERVQD